MLRAGAFVCLALATTAASLAQETPVTGKPDSRYAAFDTVVLENMKRHGATAGLLAVRWGNRLVYERGFGWQDEARTRPTPPDAMFRIASLTKPITATAVRMLIRQGKLKADTKVFEYLGLPLPQGADPRLAQITVDHLVIHHGGWDRKETSDPTWDYTSVAKGLGISAVPTPDQTVQYMMAQPLQFDPGQRRGYSNYGYLLLGKIIEKASGQPYYDFCEARIFKPMNLTNEVRRARSLLADCDPREVWYSGNRRVPSAVGPKSGETVPVTYGGFVAEYRQSFGGWAMTAAAYARFMEDFQINGEPTQRGEYVSHFGSQPGVDATALWRKDGLKIVAFINRDVENGTLASQLNDAAAALTKPAPGKTRPVSAGR
jgi:N-acyl-D-amino-acid deacylase